MTVINHNIASQIALVIGPFNLKGSLSAMYKRTSYTNIIFNQQVNIFLSVNNRSVFCSFSQTESSVFMLLVLCFNFKRDLPYFILFTS